MFSSGLSLVCIFFVFVVHDTLVCSSYPGKTSHIVSITVVLLILKKKQSAVKCNFSFSHTTCTISSAGAVLLLSHSGTQAGKDLSTRASASTSAEDENITNYPFSLKHFHLNKVPVNCTLLLLTKMGHMAMPTIKRVGKYDPQYSQKKDQDISDYITSQIS